MRTHAAILDRAMRAASVRGIHGLSIGGLAADLGMSKSGLYAHFRSKQDLQLETIQSATDLIAREVGEPTLTTPPGLARLSALCESYLSYVERRVLPGGCFFAALAAETDPRSGSVHEATVRAVRDWLGFIESTARQAQEMGEVRGDVDVAQVAFELHALLEKANNLYVLFDDPGPIRMARAAITQLMEAIAA